MNQHSILATRVRLVSRSVRHDIARNSILDDSHVVVYLLSTTHFELWASRHRSGSLTDTKKRWLTVGVVRPRIALHVGGEGTSTIGQRDTARDFGNCENVAELTIEN